MKNQKKKPVAFNINPSSDITLNIARSRHIDYLENGPYVMKGDDVIHNVILEKEHLDLLHQYGTGGVRFYFCKESDGTNDYLNLIAIPFDSNGDNVLEDSNSNSIIMNNMEPCPDKCPNDETYADSYSDNDLNYKIHTDGTTEIWCKPNIETAGKTWFDSSGNPIV